LELRIDRDHGTRGRCRSRHGLGGIGPEPDADAGQHRRSPGGVEPGLERRQGEAQLGGEQHPPGGIRGRATDQPHRLVRRKQMAQRGGPLGERRSEPLDQGAGEFGSALVGPQTEPGAGHGRPAGGAVECRKEQEARCSGLRHRGLAQERVLGLDTGGARRLGPFGHELAGEPSERARGERHFRDPVEAAGRLAEDLDPLFGRLGQPADADHETGPGLQPGERVTVPDQAGGERSAGERGATRYHRQPFRQAGFGGTRHAHPAGDVGALEHFGQQIRGQAERLEDDRVPPPAGKIEQPGRRGFGGIGREFSGQAPTHVVLRREHPGHPLGGLGLVGGEPEDLGGRQTGTGPPPPRRRHAGLGEPADELPGLLGRPSVGTRHRRAHRHTGAVEKDEAARLTGEAEAHEFDLDQRLEPGRHLAKRDPRGLGVVLAEGSPGEERSMLGRSPGELAAVGGEQHPARSGAADLDPHRRLHPTRTRHPPLPGRPSPARLYRGCGALYKRRRGVPRHRGRAPAINHGPDTLPLAAPSAPPLVHLALPKGRMQENVLQLLADAGIRLAFDRRGYRPTLSLPGFEAKLLKPQNIVEMLHLGSRDLGFAGADWVAELEADLVELVDTGLDPVTIVVAASPGFLEDGKLPARSFVVATEYERLTALWLARRGLEARIVRSYGATEVFPPEDADCIVDNTATGATLQANGLVVVDEVMRSSTRLYAHPRALEDRVKRPVIEHFTLLVRSVLDARKRVMLEVNVAREHLERVVEILPCMREPTIAPLHHDAGFAVKAAVPRHQLPELIRAIKERGGTDIVVFDIAQIVV